MSNTKHVSSELALCFGLLLNSLCVSLMVHSNLGISTLSSVPLALNELFGGFTFGTWNFLVQAFTMIVLIASTKKIKIGYVISFLIARIFGWLLDFHAIYTCNIPYNWPIRILCYMFGMVGIAFGISLFFRCLLPLLPFDTFVRDMSQAFGKPIAFVRTILDMTGVSISLGISLYLGRLVGVGIGTVASALFTGVLAQHFCSFIDKHFYFSPVIPALKRFVQFESRGDNADADADAAEKNTMQ